MVGEKLEEGGVRVRRELVERKVRIENTQQNTTT